MLEGILQGLCEWIYGLFLDLIAYCANALLGVMTTDLTFWETSVPVVTTLYQIFVAVGWGLLIGNCAFQAMKAMFAGFGFETESPAVLVLRTALFGTLLIFSRDICDIGLSIGKKVIDLVGIPTSVALTFPDGSYFTGVGASWLLVIIIGFILGFQLIKLFFEVAERYVVVAVLTLLCPVGLAMGGSKATKDICVGFIRTYVSMIAMMVLNVLFLKLLLSALGAMPSGIYVLPWCLLVVGIARVARKADNLISKIGLNPAITGDPLGHGRGMMAVMMAARTIMSSASKAGKGKAAGGKAGGNPRMPAGGAGNFHNAVGGTTVGGATASTNVRSDTGVDARSQVGQSTQNSQSSHFGAAGSTVNAPSSSSSRFGSSSYTGVSSSGTVSSSSGGVHFGSTGTTRVNANRFGAQTGVSSSRPGGNKPGTPRPGTRPSPQKGGGKPSPGKTAGKGAGFPARKGAPGSAGKPAAVPGLRQNENPFKAQRPPTGSVFISPAGQHPPTSAGHMPRTGGAAMPNNLPDTSPGEKGGEEHGE